jgi:hypothetical protein
MTTLFYQELTIGRYVNISTTTPTTTMYIPDQRVQRKCVAVLLRCLEG